MTGSGGLGVGRIELRSGGRGQASYGKLHLLIEYVGKMSVDYGDEIPNWASLGIINTSFSRLFARFGRLYHPHDPIAF